MADKDQREKVLRYYRGSGEDVLAGRLLDWADQANRYRRTKSGIYLDPRGLEIAETVVNLFPSVRLELDGGYPGAERQRITFVHEDYQGQVDSAVSGLVIVWDGRYDRLGHRDILGALLGLGIEREMLGDVVMKGDTAQVIGDSGILEFIRSNLQQAGSANVTTEELDLAAMEPREEKVKEVRATVASLRLDTIAAAGFGTSRSKMADDIESERLKLNWQEVKSPAKAVKAGDVISCRGKGRLEVTEVLGETKKGRISVLLKRYMG